MTPPVQRLWTVCRMQGRAAECRVELQNPMLLLLHAAQLVSLSSACQHDHFPHAGAHLHVGDILHEPSPTLEVVSKTHCRVTDHTSQAGPVVPGVTASVLTLASVIHWMRTYSSSVCLVCELGVGWGRKWILKEKDYELRVLYKSNLGVFCALVNVY